MPRRLWVEFRQDELRLAIKAREEAGQEVNPAWREELSWLNDFKAAICKVAIPKATSTMRRYPIQVATAPLQDGDTTLLVLANDNTLWELDYRAEGNFRSFPMLPQQDLYRIGDEEN